MRITSKGQVTIPIEIRHKLGLLPNTEVEFKIQGSTARIAKIPPKRTNHGRGHDVIDRLRGMATVKMSTDSILALTRRKG
jgi:AbrB family looped-hinge helix DNA binding protein